MIHSDQHFPNMRSPTECRTGRRKRAPRAVGHASVRGRSACVAASVDIGYTMLTSLQTPTVSPTLIVT